MKQFLMTCGLLATLSPLFAQDGGPRKADAVILIKNPNAAAGEGAQKPGWIVDSTDTTISFGQQNFQPSVLNKADLDGIQLENINASRQAHALFQNGDLVAAEDLFGKIAELFQGVAYIDSNFATEARFMQIECLRLLGQYEKIGALLNTRTGKTISKYLPAAYQKQHAVNGMWVLYANKNWEVLKERLKRFEKPQVGAEGLLPVPNFVKLEASFLAQMAFFRAAVYQSEGEKAKAIEDYYTAATAAQGSNSVVAGEALKQAVILQGENPNLAEDKSATWNVQSAAYIQKFVYADGTAPPETTAFAVLPDKPKPTFAPKEKEETAEEEEKPAEEPAAETKKEKKAKAK